MFRHYAFCFTLLCSLNYFYRNPFPVAAKSSYTQEAHPAVEVDCASQVYYPRETLSLLMADTFLIMFQSEVFGISIVFTHIRRGLFIM